MTWKEARLIAVSHIRRLGLPRRLDGKIVNIPDPGNQLVRQAVLREIHKRGGDIDFTDCSPNMILTIISPAGERWSLDPAPCESAKWFAWIETLSLPPMAAKPLALLREKKILPPKGRSLLSHSAEGWQAILSNP